MTPPTPELVAEAQRREEAFLAGLARNLEELPHKLSNPFTVWGSWTLKPDRSMAVGWDRSGRIKPAMLAAGCFDRSIQAKMPRGGAKLWSWRRRFWNRPREVAIAAVALAPLADLAAGRIPSPAGPAELTAVLDEIAARHDGGAVVICMSPGGWEADTYLRLPRRRRIRLVLVEPHPGGGWRVRFEKRHSPAEADWRAVAEPETRQQKADRVRAALAAARADLLTGGVASDQFAQRLNVPEELVAAVFHAAADDDPQLRLHVEAGRRTVYHAPVADAHSEPAEETDAMGLFQKLFGRAPDERKQIEVLSGRRSALAARRDRLFSDVAALEAKEQDLLDEGAAAETPTARRRVAAQLAMLRKDIARMSRLGGVLAQQIDVVSAQIGNLQLVVEGKHAKLPTEQELVDTAVAADAVIREVTETADQVRGLEDAMTAESASADEQEIFAEFDRRAEQIAEQEQAETEKKRQQQTPRQVEQYEPVRPETRRDRLVVDLDQPAEPAEDELEEGS